MMRSMTGYGRKEVQLTGGALSWEIRAVNHRYLELGIRLPEELRSVESKAREQIGKLLKRGKVDASLKYKPALAVTDGLTIDDALVDQVIAAATKIQSKITNSQQIDPLRVLSWPGVVGTPTVSQEQLSTDALNLLDETLQDFVASREREGAKTYQMIAERVDAIEVLTKEVRKLRPAVVERLQSKLKARLADLDLAVDPARLEQELVFSSQKLDVEEELDRLDAHVSEIRDIFKRKEPVGRRLDFLVQEFNREANTLGAKAADADTTGHSVELKVLIEQIREQVQNIE